MRPVPGAVTLPELGSRDLELLWCERALKALKLNPRISLAI
jgi:hypothetical protein